MSQYKQLVLSWIRFPLTLSLAVLSACGYVDYDKAPSGSFSGSLFVMWINDGGRSGDGAFVYVPNPDDPLTFTRSAGGSVKKIRPQMMYTDGGSIPRFAQVFEGFNPWGYAPAYMVHDWLFIAKHCVTDGSATAREKTIANMSFQESAEVIAEAIKTLVVNNRVKPNDVAPRVISSTVAGPISRGLWEREGACAGHRISEQDRKAAEAGIPGSSKPVNREQRTLNNGQVIPLVAGKVVDLIEF